MTCMGTLEKVSQNLLQRMIKKEIKNGSNNHDLIFRRNSPEYMELYMLTNNYEYSDLNMNT